MKKKNTPNQVIVKKKALTIHEICAETERRKDLRRIKLEEEIVKVIDKQDKDDIISVMSSLIYKLTKNHLL